MLDRTGRYVRKWNVLPLLALTLILGLPVGAVVVSRLISAPATARVSEVDSSPLIGGGALVGGGEGAQLGNTDPQTQRYPTCPGAFHFLWPQDGAPPNGGTVHVGDKFTFDLMLSAGPPSSNADVHQAYLTFTYGLLENVGVLTPGCVVTGTVTPDLTLFDTTLQNEVCNDTPCIYRGVSVPPGSIAFASGQLVNQPATGYFRVAQEAFCATNPGRAVLHWEFSPPAPVTRNTEALGSENIQMNPVTPRACYADYVLNIVPQAK